MAKKDPYKLRTVGRRKTSVARAYLAPGDGSIEINGRTLEDYFVRPSSRIQVQRPFLITQTQNQYRTKVTVRGGGTTGQAEAIRHALARALQSLSDKNRLLLKKAGLLTRDPRAVERKKYGRAGARKRFQYSKR